MACIKSCPSRNLQKFKFPAKLDKAREQQIISLIFESMVKCPELVRPEIFRSEDLGPLQKEFLLEHFLVLDGFHQAHAGEGFVIDDSAEFLGVLNLADHIQLNLLDTHQENEKSWNKLVKIEAYLGKTLDFAFHPRFGFLTARPRHSGTALNVTLYLHFPAVIHTGNSQSL